jgi:hypothetical protein
MAKNPTLKAQQLMHLRDWICKNPANQLTYAWLTDIEDVHTISRHLRERLPDGDSVLIHPDLLDQILARQRSIRPKDANTLQELLSSNPMYLRLFCVQVATKTVEEVDEYLEYKEGTTKQIVERNPAIGTVYCEARSTVDDDLAESLHELSVFRDMVYAGYPRAAILNTYLDLTGALSRTQLFGQLQACYKKMHPADQRMYLDLYLPEDSTTTRSDRNARTRLRAAHGRGGKYEHLQVSQLDRGHLRPALAHLQNMAPAIRTLALLTEPISEWTLLLYSLH